MLTDLRIGLTVEEAARTGAGGRTTLFKAIRAGKLRAKKNGRSTIILPDDLKAYVAALPDVKQAAA